jgi:hypothetical protein
MERCAAFEKRSARAYSRMAAVLIHSISSGERVSLLLAYHVSALRCCDEFLGR